MLSNLGKMTAGMLSVARGLLGRRVALAGAFVAIVALGPASGAAFATTYSVNRFDDPAPSANACTTTNPECSLREALIAINGTPSPPDVINLPAGNYSDDQMTVFPISQGVTIVGAGSGATTINGSLSSAAFQIYGTVQAPVSISGVTITGGHGFPVGGAIFLNSSTQALLLDRVALVGNQSGFGGAVASGVMSGGPAPITITNSLIANNRATSSAGIGGGLRSAGNLTLVNTTVTANSAGDGTSSAAYGGGIVEIAGTLVLANSTVADNTASGNGTHGGNLAFVSGGSATIRNSIVSNGHAGTADTNCGGIGMTLNVTSGGYNVEDSNQCGFSATGDLQDTDPMLGMLAANPDSSSTLALLPTSPAVNAGNPAGCKNPGGALVTTDQRGVARPQGSRCDIGAFEFRTPALAGTATVSGTAKVGQTLSCNPPAASSPDGGAVTSAFAWLRDGAAIAGATGASYTAVVADGSHMLACSFTAANAAGVTGATSAAVRVPGPPTLTGTASVTGLRTVGEKLTCNPPTVSSLGDPAATAFAWQRDGTAISGATSATYMTVAADGGHMLSCLFTARNAAGSASSTSMAVAVNRHALSLGFASTIVKVDPKTGKASVSASCTAPAGDVCAFAGALYGTGTLPAGVSTGKPNSKRAATLARLTGTIAGGKAGKITLKLTRAGLNLLEDHAPFRARLIGALTDDARDRTTLHATFKVKHGKGKFPPEI